MASAEKITLWDKIQKTIKENGVELIMEAMKNDFEKATDSEFLPPAVRFFLEQEVIPKDPRFDWDFHFPDPETTNFMKDQPIGKLWMSRPSITDPASFIERCDDNAKMLLKDELVGKSLHNLVATLLCFWYDLVKLIPLLMRLRPGKCIWFRLFLKRGDDSVGFFSTRTEKYENGLYLELQDITHVFPDYKISSFFI